MKNKLACLENNISEMRMLIESTTAGLEEEREKNDIKDSTINELKEKIYRITEEKMRMKSEHDRSTEDLELCTNVA